MRSSTPCVFERPVPACLATAGTSGNQNSPSPLAGPDERAERRAVGPDAQLAAPRLSRLQPALDSTSASPVRLREEAMTANIHAIAPESDGARDAADRMAGPLNYGMI